MLSVYSYYYKKKRVLTLNIDFHSHVKISKKSTFMPEYFQEMMQEAKDSGLTALAMTEHFNTSRFNDVYEYIDANYTYVNNYYDIDGFKLFPGIEVDVKENGHILLIGPRKDILAIRARLDNHIDEENFIAFDALMDLANEYNVLKIGGHPFRDSTPLARNISNDQLKKLDALDLNGKDLYSKGIDTCKEELEQLAELINLPIVGGSDTHQFLQYGSIINHFEKNCVTVKEIKQEIKNNHYHFTIANDLQLKVKSATLVKKYMKRYINAKEAVMS
jgi:hypothetical protein